MESRHSLSTFLRTAIIVLTVVGANIIIASSDFGYPREAYAADDCWVSVPIDTIPVSFNGYIRNNPDGSYFAGDAFNFTVSFNYGGGGVCSSPSLSVYTSEGLSITTCDSFNAGGCVKGHVEVSTGAKISDHFLYADGSISHRHCTLKFCWWHTHSASNSYTARVIDPKPTLALRIVNMTDADGYRMRNLDESYYLQDAIAVRHEVDYLFKNDRIGTIEPITTKTFVISKKEAEFDCKSGILCSYTLVNPAITPFSDTYNYGYGITLYNGTSSIDYGNQIFNYQTKLYNIGQEFTGNTVTNSTSALVVKYQPKYDVYPYIILKDEDQWSYGKRLAIAAHYVGSEGGAKDDTFGIHEQRRSKINNYTYVAYAYNVTESVPITKDENGTSIILKWQFTDSLDPAEALGSTDQGKHAMFVKTGYAKLVLDYPVKDYITKTRLENVTLDGVFVSKRFAGNENTNLFNLNYTYPAVKFGNTVTVKAVDSGGGVDPIPLGITLVPLNDTLHGYLRDKIIQDTGDAKFADIVLDDVYDRNNAASGTGFIALKVNMTSLLVPDLSETIWGDKMSIPLHYALAGLTPYVITIDAKGVTKTLNVTLYQHYSDLEFLVNMDDDNVLNATRYGHNVVITPDKNFGSITALKVNGTDYDLNCRFGCTIFNDKAMLLDAYNEWGGKAHATISAATTPEVELPPPSSSNLTVFYVSLAGSLGVVVLYFAVKRWLKILGKLFD